jgi:hypothetical protein
MDVDEKQGLAKEVMVDVNENMLLDFIINLFSFFVFSEFCFL